MMDWESVKRAQTLVEVEWGEIWWTLAPRALPVETQLEPIRIVGILKWG